MANVNISLISSNDNVLYFGRSSSAHTLKLRLYSTDVNSSYYCAWNVYVGGTLAITGDMLPVAGWTNNRCEIEVTASSYTSHAEKFPSNSTTAEAYCKVTTYKSDQVTPVGSHQVNFIAKLHEDVRPTIGDIHLNPADVKIYDEDRNILLNDYNRFGIYIGYKNSSDRGNLWCPTPGSSIVSYTISGSGIATKIISTTNGYYRHAVDKVNVSGTVSDGQQLTYTVTVQDSRGRKNSKTVAYNNFYPYFSPIITISDIYRADQMWPDVRDENNGTYITIKFTIQYAKLDGYNGCDYKICKDGTQLDVGSAESGKEITSQKSLGDTKAHQISIQVTDGLGNTTTYLYNLPGIGRIVNIKNNGLGIAFGKKAEGDSQIQSSWTFVGPVNNTSDEKVKTNITGIDVDILNTLKPVQYNFTHIADEQIHYGFVAQDVVKSLESAGVDVDTVGLIGHTVHHGELLYTLAYTEFIPLIVKKCQELQKENNEMRAEIAEIKTMLLAHNSE